MVTKSFKMPQGVVIPCPEKEFALRKIESCLKCEFYGGLKLATMNGDKLPFHADNFQVICKRPVTRKLLMIEAD